MADPKPSTEDEARAIEFLRLWIPRSFSWLPADPPVVAFLVLLAEVRAEGAREAHLAGRREGIKIALSLCAEPEDCICGDKIRALPDEPKSTEEKPCRCAEYREDPDVGDSCLCGHVFDLHDHHAGALMPICRGIDDFLSLLSPAAIPDEPKSTEGE